MGRLIRCMAEGGNCLFGFSFMTRQIGRLIPYVVGERLDIILICHTKLRTLQHSSLMDHQVDHERYKSSDRISYQ